MALNAKQQALRRTGIGASEIAALAGLSRWAKPIEIYESKVLGKPLEEGYQLDLGNEMEAPIARIWAARKGKHLALVDTMRHPTKPLAVATPDRAIYSDPALRGDARRKRTDVRDAEALLQVKSSSWRMRRFWGNDGSDDVPDDFQAQAQWEAGVAGLPEVIFAVDFDKTALHEFRVVARPEIFEALYEIAERFWTDHVLARKPPEPDGSPAYDEFLERFFPQEKTKDYRDVPTGSAPDFERAVAEFLMLRAADKRLKARRDQLYQQIVSFIGFSPGVRGAFGTISYKRTKDRIVFEASDAFTEALSFVRLAASARPDDETAKMILAHLEKLRAEKTTTKKGWRSMRPQPADHLKFAAPITLTLAADGEAHPQDEEEGTES